jgi:hypothetical protein
MLNERKKKKKKECCNYPIHEDTRPPLSLLFAKKTLYTFPDNCLVQLLRHSPGAPSLPAVVSGGNPGITDHEEWW